MIVINTLNCETITIASGTPGPVVKAETHIKFVDGTEGDYLIEGAMDCPALVAAGLMPEGSGTSQEPSWIKQPLEANIGSAVTSIGWYAFYNCSGLTSVTIPDSVTSIGVYAFFLCSGLTSVTIPDGVTSIEGSAFYGCSGLTSVTIPDSVTSIGSQAFLICSGLTSVTFNSFTKNEVKSLTDRNYIFGGAFYDDEGNPIEKSFTAICTDGSMTVHFSEDDPATITFTDL